MYSKTQFGQLLEGFPRGTFERMVNQEQTDKYSKGFRSWDHFVAMIYGHLSGSKSLRELEAGFNAQTAHHYHLGTKPLKRSTLSDANAKRSYYLFERVCQQLISGVHRKLKRELEQMLYLMDSSPISLHGPGFDNWASQYKNNLRQGLKLHLMIEAHQGTPCYATITGMQVSDIKEGHRIKLEKGTTYVFDRGYYDYNWWYEINRMQSVFVTRLKKNANVRVEGYRDIPSEEDQILEDAIIYFNNPRVKSRTEKNAYRDDPVRRIIVKREDKETPLVIVTNDFNRTASEVAALYKKRWDIELFFKWIKQNLKIKSFLGRSENAVKIQLFTALISYLLLQIYQQKNDIKTSLKLCLSILRVSLFQHVKTEHVTAQRYQRHREKIRGMQPELVF
jgi:putative transposase